MTLFRSVEQRVTTAATVLLLLASAAVRFGAPVFDDRGVYEHWGGDRVVTFILAMLVIGGALGVLSRSEFARHLLVFALVLIGGVSLVAVSFATVAAFSFHGSARSSFLEFVLSGIGFYSGLAMVALSAALFLQSRSVIQLFRRTPSQSHE